MKQRSKSREKAVTRSVNFSLSGVRVPSKMFIRIQNIWPRFEAVKTAFPPSVFEIVSGLKSTIAYQAGGKLLCYFSNVRLSYYEWNNNIIPLHSF